MAQLHDALFFGFAGISPMHDFINTTETAKANILVIKAAVSYAG
jgi:hypothetical protein